MAISGDPVNPTGGAETEPTAFAVLREHCAFLKEQLSTRETWRQQEMARLGAENDVLRRRCEDLSVALAEAMQANEDLDDGRAETIRDLIWK